MLIWAVTVATTSARCDAVGLPSSSAVDRIFDYSSGGAEVIPGSCFVYNINPCATMAL